MESIKPILHDLNQLHVDYARYRRLLCAAKTGLDDRLTQGKRILSDDFLQVASGYHVIFLDAYGVLVVGNEPIPGAVAAVKELRRMGKHLRLVTNNASQSPQKVEQTYLKYGFDFADNEIIASGMVVKDYVSGCELKDRPYFLIGTGDSRQAYAPDPDRLAMSPPQVAEGGYVLVCSNRDYYGDPALITAVERVLAGGQTTVVLANPDLVAPEADGGLNPVAGYTVARWMEHHSFQMIGLGKPFPPIFNLALQSLPPLSPHQILMVGDTLDTDILGGINMGFATCLTATGSYRGMKPWEIENLCLQKGIYPDFCVNGIG